MTAAPSLADKIVAIHQALDDAYLSHAFGGALALAWCTQRARGTIDIDVNVFVPAERTGELLTALPTEISATDAAVAQLHADGQTILMVTHSDEVAEGADRIVGMRDGKVDEESSTAAPVPAG